MVDPSDEMTSLSSEKRRALWRDLYFRECLADLSDACGDESPIEASFPLGLLTFKPDAVFGRRLRPAIDLLVQNSFRPTWMSPIRYTRHSMRELWRYNWDTYTTDRLALTTMMHTSCESLMLILHDPQTARTGIPASVRLSDLKGSAAPEDRRPGQLRDVLSPPNAVINFVHVADEPGDVIREVGIFLDRADRQRLWREVLTDPQADVTAQAISLSAQLEGECDAHDFDFEASLSRVQERGFVSREAAERLRSVARGEEPKIRLGDLHSIVSSPQAEEIPVWDFVSIACGVLELVRDGAPDLLPGAGIDDWKAHLGGVPIPTAGA